MHVITVLGVETDSGAEEIIKEITEENFPELIKDINTKTQVQKIPKLDKYTQIHHSQTTEKIKRKF